MAETTTTDAEPRVQPSTTPLLEVSDLSISYRVRRRAHLAVADASFTIGAGETLGLVGESGSGKTTISRAVLGLLPVDSGRIVFEGTDLASAGRRERRRHAGELRAVFQDPYSSLNPALPVAASLKEGLDRLGVSPQDAQERMELLLDRIGLPASVAHGYPRTLSGGQRQRLAIGRALMTKPRLLVCDEPVSALDVSVQAQVLNLLREVQAEARLGCLFIGHDLDVVRFVSDRIAVLYRGRIVEYGTAEQVTGDPQHPYTKRLMQATPKVRPARTVPGHPTPETTSAGSHVLRTP